MMRDPLTAPTVSHFADDAWTQVEALLDEIAVLSKSQLPPREFHRELLERLMRLLAASGGAIWRREAPGKWVLDWQVQLESVLSHLEGLAWQTHGRLLQDVAEGGAPRLVPPQAGDTQAANPTPFLLALAPLSTGQAVVGMVELFRPPEPRGEQLQGYLRVLAVATELAQDYHQGRQLLELSRRLAFWDDFERFCGALHRSLDLRATGFAVANEGRRLLACDRLSVVTRQGRRYRVLAVSGVDTVHRRANLTRQLENLVEVCLPGQDSLWFPGNAGPLPPQIEAALDAFVDESHAAHLAVVPLNNTVAPPQDHAQPLGALVIEWFTACDGDELPLRTERLGRQAALALRNAQEYGGLPLLGVLRALRQARWYIRLEQLPRTLTAAALLGLIAAVLMLMPADFDIAARGELQPQRRFHVFAPHDGIVASLPQTDRAVRRGETLARLLSPSLNLDFSEVEGKRKTVQQQLDAVLAARLRNDPAPSASADAVSLSAQEQQLREELRALEEQQRILMGQQQELEIRSPADGHVLTWNVPRLLADRPVQRGDQLMTVADLQGPWEVELRIDDAVAGHVLAARQDMGPELAVEFLLASEPGTRYRGQLRELGDATEVDDAGRPVVWAKVLIPAAHRPPPRPGATVLARIHCGRRSLGYVWFHSLLDAIRTYILF